jgi:hypothetical protein
MRPGLGISQMMNAWKTMKRSKSMPEFDMVWARNRIRHALRAAAEEVKKHLAGACMRPIELSRSRYCTPAHITARGQGIMDGELRDVPGKFSFRDARQVVWDPPRPSTCEALECPEQPGLYSFRGFLTSSEARSIAVMAERVCGVGDTCKRGHTRWNWFEYETAARRVAPILIDSPLRERSGELQELEGFEVFGGVSPQSWLFLSALANSRDEKVQQGGALLSQLVWNRMPALGIATMQVPSFLQLQALERGNGIQPHIDAAVPRADAVATIGLVASTVIRVGPVLLRVNAGDLYVLTGAARWSVKHEVLPPTRDRMSLTTRFNSPEQM